MELLAEAPDFLRGSFVVDKVVGRAAAMLMIHGGVAALHANLISEPAVSTLTAHNLPFTCDARTPYIQNRDKTGYCPMEQTCLDIDDPAEAYLALQAKLQAMKKGK